ncbi:CAF17-like 4Fe-4S cluster assembly/insertion protein YgfZ [Methylacidiphilum caldifontis]|uniref:CAF17-like 4Fe-4S cluster assembly/insertion protein YgfZ n=1 Tax=Methylacidiphilum caldifontis TaxID=2795386 RepID=UPI00106A3758|nr:glycine cleavage T C-terminal barrel domain-containing protein [Methylacidiphilum caldifontis]
MNEQKLYESLVQGHPGWCSLLSQSLWTVRGKDRIRYLNGQLAADISSLPIGSSVHTAALNRKGRIDCDLWIANQGETIFVDGPKEIEEQIANRLSRFLVADQVSIEKIDGQFFLYHYFGPHPPKGFTLCFQNKRFGIEGWDIWSDTSLVDFGCPEVPPTVQESLRLENMIPQWDKEITEQTIPLEVFLTKQSISFTKGCYVGQEIISRIHHLGQINQLLTLFIALENSNPQPGQLYYESRAVGRLTSCGYSFGYNKTIALGFIHREHRKEQNRVESNGCFFKILKAPPPIG